MATNFRAGNASAITNGGTAVAAIIGPCNGGYIINGVNATQQGGIGAAEALYIDPTQAPGSTDGAANGTAQPLPATGGTWMVSAAIPAGQTIYANAATTGHKFTCVIW